MEKSGTPVPVGRRIIDKDPGDSAFGYHASDFLHRHAGTSPLHDSLFRMIADAAVDCIFCKDSARRYTYVNPAMLKLLDLPAEQVIGYTPSEVYEPEIAATVAEVDAPTFRGETVDAVHPLRLRGKDYFLHTIQRPIRDPNGTVIGIFGIVRDVTRRQRALQMIHALEKNYRETLDAMPNAIHVVGRDLRILLSNRFMRKWLVKIGTDPEIAGKPFLEAFPFLPPSIEQEYRKVFAIGRILQTEEETVLPGGALIFTETTKIPILENGVVEKVVTVLSDVTEAKRAERAIRESEEAVARLQKLDSIGKVAGGIAHDFNNYLTGILGNITLAMTECGEGSRQREFLSVAEKAIIQAKGLSRQLLSFAKGNVSNERKPVLIESVVRNAIDLALCGSRVKTQFRFASDLPRIEADESQLYQVFHNVSVNAVQAMPQGGRLLVVAEPVSLRSDDFSELPGGIYLRISFTDTGSGIPEDVLPHIFDPFYTTRSEGNGLGLSTCLSIIRSHRGTISVVSSPGAGTTFSIFLPATGDWGCSE